MPIGGTEGFRGRMRDFRTEGNPDVYDALRPDSPEPEKALAILADPGRRDNLSIADWAFILWGFFWDGLVRGAVFRREGR